MHKKFEINRKKIKGSCQLGSIVVTHDSKSDLPLVTRSNDMTKMVPVGRSAFVLKAIRKNARLGESSPEAMRLILESTD